MGRISAVALGAILALFAAGCRGVAMPNLGYPGPAAYQQSRAQRYDPYPENDAGPAIDGGRPRDYQTPVAEPSRARWNARTWFSRFGF